MVNRNKEIRMKWEKDDEYDYRVKTGMIIIGIAQVMDEIKKMTTKREPNDKAKQIMITHKNMLYSIKTPLRYKQSREYFLNCIIKYIEGIKMLNSGIYDNDAKIIYKAGLLIKAGNAWMELTKIQIHFEIGDIIN